MSLRTLLLALGMGLLVYLVIAVYGYFGLLAHQSEGPPPFQEGATSFPPSYAFFVATPFGLLAFLIALAVIPIAELLLKELQRRRALRPR